jgi:hypothetical protein
MEPRCEEPGGCGETGLFTTSPFPNGSRAIHACQCPWGREFGEPGEVVGYTPTLCPAPGVQFHGYESKIERAKGISVELLARSLERRRCEKTLGPAGSIFGRCTQEKEHEVNGLPLHATERLSFASVR